MANRPKSAQTRDGACGVRLHEDQAAEQCDDRGRGSHAPCNLPGQSVSQPASGRPLAQSMRTLTSADPDAAGRRRYDALPALPTWTTLQQPRRGQCGRARLAYAPRVGPGGAVGPQGGLRRGGPRGIRVVLTPRLCFAACAGRVRRWGRSAEPAGRSTPRQSRAAVDRLPVPESRCYTEGELVPTNLRSGHERRGAGC
jgi:hypothetical protein